MSEAVGLDDVIAFLMGEKALDGRWFGDDPLEEPRRQPYWWRSVLRDARHRAKLTASLTGEGEPVAWQVKDYADGWITFYSHERARQEAEEMGALIRPLYTRRVAWPDREAVASALHARYEERARQRGTFNAESDHTILGGRTLADCSASLRQSFLEDADAVLSLLSGGGE